MESVTNRKGALAQMDTLLNEAKSCCPEVDLNWWWEGLYQQLCLSCSHQAWKLVEKWGLEKELAKHENRDFALLYSPHGSIEPKDVDWLLWLAICIKNYAVVVNYFQHLKSQELTLLIDYFPYWDEEYASKLKSMILERFPVMDKKCTKAVVSSGHLIARFYSSVAHFGPKLYYWNYYTRTGDVNFEILAKRKCPADTQALNLAILRPVKKCVKELLSLGAQLDEESQRIMEKEFSHWLFFTDEEVRQGYERYGVDPNMDEDDFPEDSFDSLIRLWLKFIQGKFNKWSHRKARRKFRVCLPRIKEVEPKVYERLMLLEP